VLHLARLPSEAKHPFWLAERDWLKSF